MATLELTHSDLKIEIGRHLGFGRSGEYTGDKDVDINSAIKRGLLRFYFPIAHQWSFLMPWAEISLNANVRSYDLPEDFARIGDGFHRQVNSGEMRIEMTSVANIRSMTAQSDQSGDPVYAAIRTKRVPSGSRSVYQVEFYPSPSEAVTVEYQYTVEPAMLVDDGDRPLGGAIHAQTILLACLSEADEILNPEGGKGVFHQRYEEALAASIVIDGGRNGISD